MWAYKKDSQKSQRAKLCDLRVKTRCLRVILQKNISIFFVLSIFICNFAAKVRHRVAICHEGCRLRVLTLR